MNYLCQIPYFKVDVFKFNNFKSFNICRQMVTCKSTSAKQGTTMLHLLRAVQNTKNAAVSSQILPGMSYTPSSTWNKSIPMSSLQAEDIRAKRGCNRVPNRFPPKRAGRRRCNETPTYRDRNRVLLYML